MTVLNQIVLTVALIVIAGEVPAENNNRDALVIAHRGASGYLPEHTLAAKVMAYAQGSDFIEQDLVMTKDDELVVLHDRYLDTVTNVAAVYPHRSRGDGRYYVVDFTLGEIQRLSVSERFEIENGVVKAVFDKRFPLGKSSFRVHTFAAEIELVQGLNQSTGKSVGIYPEMKSPAYHHIEGKDIASATLKVLQQYGYTDKTHQVFLQCFEAKELRRIHDKLMPKMRMDLRLVQLMEPSDEYAWMLGQKGMRKVATYADGIGPSIDSLLSTDSVPPDIKATPLINDAHAAGLVVHPYTFRRERDQMPPFSTDYADFLRLFIDEFGVDGVFTDFPDLTVQFLESNE